jgi:hypothetical protein
VAISAIQTVLQELQTLNDSPITPAIRNDDGLFRRIWRTMLNACHHLLLATGEASDLDVACRIWFDQLVNDYRSVSKIQRVVGDVRALIHRELSQYGFELSSESFQLVVAS